MAKQSTLETRELSSEEISALITETEALASRFTSCESPEFADAVSLAALNLPLSLRQMAYKFRMGYGPSSLLLKGFPVDQQTLMPTPESWDFSWQEPRILRLEIGQTLVASLLGEIFGWRTQENGRFLRHIIPHPNDAYEQLGSSSAIDLEWHNEDAFHPSRADFLVLMCYRNQEAAISTVCSTSVLDLSEKTIEILRQSRFIIVPDKSHRADFNKSEQWQLGTEAFARIESMLNNPQPEPILSGPLEKPFIRIDPAFMHAIDAEGEQALAEIRAEIDRKIIDVILQPGEFLLIDNLRAVHGRRSFKPVYGAEKRWMRRVNIATDLVKSGRTLNVGSKRCFI